MHIGVIIPQKELGTDIGALRMTSTHMMLDTYVQYHLEFCPLASPCLLIHLWLVKNAIRRLEISPIPKPLRNPMKGKK